MKIGIILFIIGALMALYFSKIKFKKQFLSKLSISIGIILALYGIVLIVQPDEDKYVKFTKTTISKSEKEKDIKD